MAKVQRKSSLKTDLQVVVQNVRANLQDDVAWQRTIDSYPIGSAKLIDCLRDDVPPGHFCATGSSVTDINLRRPDGTIFYQGENPNQGWQPSGAPCNTFDPLPGPGNDDCPFRYEVTVNLTCVAGATCQKPKVQLLANLLVNPASKGETRFNINTSNYNFDIDRSQQTQFEPMQVRHWQTTNAPGGQCNYNAWQVRPVTEEVYDQGEHLTLVGGGFRLNRGSYECTVEAQSFHQPLGFRLRLRMTDGLAQSFFVGSGATAPDSPASITGNANFTITAPTTFVVEHYCPASPGAADPMNFNSAPQNAFHMGLPMPDYAQGSSFTKVECVRSS